MGIRHRYLEAPIVNKSCDVPGDVRSCLDHRWDFVELLGPLANLGLQDHLLSEGCCQLPIPGVDRPMKEPPAL